MAYPTSIDTFAIPAGTNTLSSPDHTSEHLTVSGAISGIETVLGTTAGTSVLKDFTAGQFPVRVNSGGTLQQSFTGGTINNFVIGTPSITGGTGNNMVLGTPTITGVTYVKSKVGTTSFDISTNGTITVSGVGFTPKTVDINAILLSSRSRSIGYTDGTSSFCNYADQGGTMGGQDTSIVVLFTTYATTAGAATFGSMTADGFTIVSNKLGSPTGTALIIYRAIG